jgi:plastocyanin
MSPRAFLAPIAAALLAVPLGAVFLTPSNAPSQTAGTVRGRVDLRTETGPDSPRPGVASLGHDTLYRPNARKSAVVYLETAPQPAFEEGGTPRVSMRQEHETFIPHVLAIRAGTVVEFPNFDPVYHNVFSLSKPKPFDLGRYGTGRSKSVRFDDPGIVRVFCDIHSHMSAFILVFAHRFYAVTDEQGRYRIDRVPPGTYTVTAWYEGAARASRSVAVPADGGVVDIDFALR